MIDWFFLATIIVIGLGAWLAVAVLGALVVGKGIKIADERESPDPWEAGPDSRPRPTLPTQRRGDGIGRECQPDSTRPDGPESVQPL